MRHHEPPSWRRRIAFAVMPVACGLIFWFETHHRIATARAWTFGSVFMLAAAAAVLLAARSRNAAFAVATISLALCLLELAAVAIEPSRGTLVITPRWLVVRPVLGFGFDRPVVVHSHKTDPQGRLVFDAHYTIGDSLDRVVRSPTTGPATVFFGDSYTFGEGLNDDATLPQQFADLEPMRRVLNLAITGYSPQQFLRAVETGVKDAAIGPKPDVFISLTSPFHARRTACKESWTNYAPRYALVDGKVTYQGACYEGVALWGRDFCQNSALCRTLIQPWSDRLTHADVDLYIRILAQAVREARARYGVETLVPFVRSPPHLLDGTGWDDDSILAAMRAQGLWVVDMSLEMNPDAGFTIRGDGHPTAKANQIRARMIATALNAPDRAQQAAPRPK